MRIRIKTRKAQVGFEGLIMIGIIFLFFIASIALISSKNEELFRVEKIVQERESCFKLVNLLTNTYVLGDGTTIQNKIYHNMTIIPSEQRIIGTYVTCTIPINSLTSSELVESSMTVGPGSFRIINNEGIITINNI